MLTIQVTDKRKFKKVSEVDLSDASKTMRNNSFDGDVMLHLATEELTFSGQHGANDWEEDYGFIVLEKKEA